MPIGNAEFALLESPDARRMVAVWRKAGASCGVIPSETLIERWAALAGVPRSVAKKHASTLWELGIVLEYGTVDARAAEFCGLAAMTVSGVRQVSPGDR